MIISHIPFYRTYATGKEMQYIEESISSLTISGNGSFTKRCEYFLQEKLKIPKALLTTSCTDALEMCAILCNLQPGDEVIVPSYTFVSSALAFIRCGAKIIFADSSETSPCLDVNKIEQLISSRTRAIVSVHYAGIACDMDTIMTVASKYNLLVIEDAAQSIDSYFKGRPLGSIGHLAAFSFHESKNIQCGEGGLLAINDIHFNERAEIIWEKGTNRAEFFRGEVDKYGWRDTGSSFLPADYVAAFLWAQLEEMDQIQAKRKAIWNQYYFGLKDLTNIKLPQIPEYATNNGHIFYILCSSATERSKLINYLKGYGIYTAFHYLSLHKSNYIMNHQKDSYSLELPYADYYTDHLLRLPLFTGMTKDDVDTVIDRINKFYNNSNK